tara:strand:+ start:203 stop:751 length:549 start_codon:yes stop_codon:yes gene_type:complete
MKFSALALAALGDVNAMINLFGTCPEVKLAQNFDKAAFAGNWYEISRDGDFLVEMGQECVTLQLTSQTDGSLNFSLRAWMWQLLGGYSGVLGNLTQCGDQTNPTCIATSDTRDEAFNYNVLYVNDEHTVAVNYFCDVMMLGAFSFSWWNVVSKTPTLDAASLTAAQNAVLGANAGYTALYTR